jgi:hypothetical protein
MASSDKRHSRRDIDMAESITPEASLGQASPGETGTGRGFDGCILGTGQ